MRLRIVTPTREEASAAARNVGAAGASACSGLSYMVDCSRFLDPARFEGVAEYVALGRDEPDSAVSPPSI